MPLSVITASAGAALELRLPVSCSGDGDGSRGVMGWLNDGCLGSTGEGPAVEAAAARGRPCAVGSAALLRLLMSTLRRIPSAGTRQGVGGRQGV